jgi:hypothetical protein
MVPRQMLKVLTVLQIAEVVEEDLPIMIIQVGFRLLEAVFHQAAAA